MFDTENRSKDRSFVAQHQKKSTRKKEKKLAYAATLSVAIGALSAPA